MSVTLEEFVHIRSVLTKAELESLPVENHVKEDAEKGKVSIHAPLLGLLLSIIVEVLQKIEDNCGIEKIGSRIKKT